MVRPSQIATLGTVLSALVLAHCVRVPAPDYLAKGPQVDEIVRRVKCDLYESLEPRLSAAYGYEWLHSWTAQANLNLIVNDQSQLTPGATFTEPLRAATIPLKVTNFSQSANLGLGAQANDTATRNETVTFTVSMDELTQFGNGPHNCEFPNYIDLQSELGLKEWVDAALSPVAAGDLNVGYHKTPKSGSAAAATSAKAAITTGQGALAQAPKQTPAAKAKTAGVLNCDDPTQIPTRSSGPPGPETRQSDELLVACELGLFFRAKGAKGAIDLSSQLDGEQVKRVAQIINDIDRLIEELSLVNSDAATRESAALKKSAISLTVFVDPPLDTISHQIQFIIVWNASASPSWTLLHFKGPAPSGTLFSATKTKTHTLNVVIGPPSSQDSQGALQALQVGTAVGNALGTSGLSTP
jgi:hypothetical protein